MNDEKQPNADRNKPPRRTPNREFQRMPRVIEGEALTASSAAPAAASADDKLDTTSPLLAAAPDLILTEPVVTELVQIDGAKPEQTTPEQTTPEQTTPEPVRESIVSVEEDIRTTDTKSAETLAGAPSEPLTPPLPPPPEERRSYGLGALAAASLGSAALAALAVFGLQTMTTPAGPSPALEARIAEVERQAASAAKTQSPAPAAIAALEKRVASVEAVATGAAESARKAVEATAARPASAQPGSSAPSPQALGALGDRLAQIEKSITAAPDLDGRIAAIEKALAVPKSDERATETRVEPAPPPDLDPLRKQAAALETRLQTLERQTSPLAEAGRAAEARIKSVEASVQPLAGQIEETRTRSEAERKRIQALAERSAGAAQIALAQSISSAIAAGAPFAAQIEALGRLGLPAEKLAPLLPLAKTGVATNAELARTLAALEPKITVRAEASADASVIDRLTNSALGLVRVRPAGETTGASPSDVFARMTRAMQAGDIALALKEWDTLPDGAKAASADWSKRARERLAAEGAARALLAEQAQTLGRS